MNARAGYKAVLLFLWCAIAGSITPVSAPWLTAGQAVDTTELSFKDINILVRVLGLMTPRPKGTLDVAIVYDPTLAGSLSEAQAIADTFDAFQSSRASFKARLVPADSDETIEADMIYYSPSISSGVAALTGPNSDNGSVTISTDRACINAGNCILAITKEPLTNLWYNRSASDAAGIQFSAALLMLAKRQ